MTAMSEELADRRLLTAAQLAADLACSTDKVYDMVAEGLPHVRLGRGKRAPLRFARPAVMAWLEEGTTANAVPVRKRATPPDSLFEPRRFIS